MIRDARGTKAWTQAQLPELMGFTQATISNVERGTRNLHLETLLTLFAALELELFAQPKPTMDLVEAWQ